MSPSNKPFNKKLVLKKVGTAKDSWSAKLVDGRSSASRSTRLYNMPLQRPTAARALKSVMKAKSQSKRKPLAARRYHPDDFELLAIHGIRNVPLEDKQYLVEWDETKEEFKKAFDSQRISLNLKKWDFEWKKKCELCCKSLQISIARRLKIVYQRYRGLFSRSLTDAIFEATDHHEYIQLRFVDSIVYQYTIYRNQLKITRKQSATAVENFLNDNETIRRQQVNVAKSCFIESLKEYVQDQQSKQIELDNDIRREIFPDLSPIRSPDVNIDEQSVSAAAGTNQPDRIVNNDDDSTAQENLVVMDMNEDVCEVTPLENDEWFQEDATKVQGSVPMASTSIKDYSDNDKVDNSDVSMAISEGEKETEKTSFRPVQLPVFLTRLRHYKHKSHLSASTFTELSWLISSSNIEAKIRVTTNHFTKKQRSRMLQSRFKRDSEEAGANFQQKVAVFEEYCREQGLLVQNHESECAPERNADLYIAFQLYCLVADCAQCRANLAKIENDPKQSLNPECVTFVKHTNALLDKEDQMDM